MGIEGDGNGRVYHDGQPLGLNHDSGQNNPELIPTPILLKHKNFSGYNNTAI